MKNKQKIPKSLYFLLGGLLLIFLILLVLSTTNYNVEKNIKFVETITLDNSTDQYELGVFEITNNGILPKKVFLDKYLVCDQNKNNVNVEYSNSNYQRGDIFWGNNQEYVDISGGESKELFLRTQYYFNLKPQNNRDDNKIKTLYIFEEESQEYTSCRDKSLNEAITQINIENEQ